MTASWKNGAAPDSDGITVEFLKVFWSDRGKRITAWFNSACAIGSMSSCQCNTVATLIHKGEDLPRNELKNCRTTFLLNSDYKLLAKCLTLRLSRVTCDISNIDQVGYIKGLRVSSLLRLIDDITDKQNV